MKHQRFTGKTVVVTGGGSGIGQAIAVGFAAEGAHLAIVELTREKAAETVARIAASNGSADVYPCDVSDHGAMARTMESIREACGRIDILINNAGIAHIGKLENTSEADLDRIYAVNVKGVYNGMHAAIGPMCETGGGVILNLASIASKVGIQDRFAYSMSKGAVLTMTLSVARDYVDRNIRCNCICPARVHTPFVDNYLRENYPGQEDEVFKTLSEYQPIGRMAKPGEIAALALYLCSDDASFITGAAYDIDGGVMNLR
jgi:NAD(P)-dependent dehydrogenase (short-subunit alcohol dehydrogenase family)